MTALVIVRTGVAGVVFLVVYLFLALVVIPLVLLRLQRRRPPELEGVQRASVYTPCPGDVVVFEVGLVPADAVQRFRTRAEEILGVDVKVIVVAGGRLAGVVRRDG